MLVDHYVKDEEGTGVVHQAPYFGAVSSIILQMCLWEVNGSGHFAWDAESPVSLSVSQLPRPVESAFFFFWLFAPRDSMENLASAVPIPLVGFWKQVKP